MEGLGAMAKGCRASFFVAYSKMDCSEGCTTFVNILKVLELHTEVGE